MGIMMCEVCDNMIDEDKEEMFECERCGKLVCNTCITDCTCPLCRHTVEAVCVNCADDIKTGGDT